MGVEQALRRMGHLLDDADRVLPTDQVLHRAGSLLAVHPLRAGDSLQLAAALTWCKGNPAGHSFACLDEQLCAAANQVGFTTLPGT